MPGLSRHNPIWDQARAGDQGRVLEDVDILVATDFEGGNGADIRRLDGDSFAITLENEPGGHDFSGKPYYVCFGVRNKRMQSRAVRVRLEAAGWGNWGAQTQHLVLRRGGKWSQLDPAAIRKVEGMPDAVTVDIPLPGADDTQGTLFVSNFHWWPYSERVAYVRGLQGARVREIGRSHQGRPMYAVEIGREDPDAPCMVHAQTQQPSEMGHLACRALIDYLLSDEPSAVSMRRRHRICFLPMTNPDGTVMGYGVSDAMGRMPCFEGHLAAFGDQGATPEGMAIWRYLQEQRPWLLWFWHSNNWARRPGHMVYRYRGYLMEDARQRALEEAIGPKLLALPDTHFAMWLSPSEGHHYGTRPTLYAMQKLGAMVHIIKQHDKFPLEQSGQHAIDCLQAASTALDAEGI